MNINLPQRESTRILNLHHSTPQKQLQGQRSKRGSPKKEGQSTHNNYELIMMSITRLISEIMITLNTDLKSISTKNNNSP